MPSYSSLQPFSSGDDIDDKAWNAAVQQWKANQGRWDPVAAGGSGDRDMVDAPVGPDAILQLAQAQMPHVAWQALRARQLAAGDDAGGSADEPAPAPAPAGSSAAERIADAAGAEGQAYRDGADLIRQGLHSAGRIAMRGLFGSDPEPATSTNPAVRWAEQQIGHWGYSKMLNGAPDVRGASADRLHGLGAPKCNQFVYDALTAAGAPPGRMENGEIPMAHNWGDPNSRISGYEPVTDGPRPGDVVSDGDHVGLYAPLPDGRPGTISAASPAWLGGHAGLAGGVIHNDWGFRKAQHVVLWRVSNR